jgi:hypothetical protein
MANGTTLSGGDTLTLNDKTITDIANGDYAVIDFPNNISSTTIGKNNNILKKQMANGKLCRLTIRLTRGSVDDIFLQDLFDLQQRDFAAFNLLEGQAVKRIGDGEGNITRDIYDFSAMDFEKIPNSVSSTEENVEELITIWQLSGLGERRI